VAISLSLTPINVAKLSQIPHTESKTMQLYVVSSSQVQSKCMLVGN